MSSLRGAPRLLLAGMLVARGVLAAEPAARPPDQPAPAAAAPPPAHATEGPAAAAPHPEPLPAPAADPDVPPAERIAAINVEGNRRIETSAIATPLETKVGNTFDPTKLRRDIRSLWSEKFFDDIKVDIADSPKGKVVTFIVKEKPLVRDVKIKGNDEIDEDDLRKELEIKPFQIYDVDLARKTVKKFQAKYADKGFFLAEITFTAEKAPGDNEVDVVFHVIEHAKVEVKRITFLGNHALTDDEIKDSLATQEGGLLSFLTSSGTYKEDAFQRDLLIIQSLYLNKGYVNVRVGHPEVSLTADKRYIYINIPIEEGEPYDVGKVGFSGDLLGDEGVLPKLSLLESGKRFGSEKLQKTMLALEDHYKDRGYAYVLVQPRTAVDPAKKTIDFDFVVTPGVQVYIERIDIVGNTKTRDKVIRRELRISEGDLYDGTAVKVSRQRVTALGFFEAVDITSRPGSKPNMMIMEVAIKEKATGTFQVGLGFSSQEPILLNANVSQNNALGWGSSAGIMAQVSNIRRIFSLNYTDPYFLDTKWTAGFDIFNTLQIISDFERSAFGGNLTGGYLLFDDFRVFLTYTLQQVNVTPSLANAVLFANRFRSGLTSSVKVSFNYDRRDNRLFPTRGYFLSGSVEYANPSVTGSQTDFVRLLGVARYYHPVFAGIVFKVNASIGYIGSPASNPVPVSELFYEGGINSLRGFNFRGVAPLVPAGTAPGAPLTPELIGGNKELLSNWELEFPIVQDVGLRGVVFYDMGNVYADNQAFFASSAGGTLGLLMSVGFGVRWFTPLGPLRFEWGFPVEKRPTDPTNQFEFTIGNFF